MASGAGAAALACLDLLVDHGPPVAEHHRHRLDRRRLARPHGGDGPAQGALCQGDQRAHARRGHRRRRHLPRPFRARRAEAGDGGEDGGDGRSSSRSPIPTRRSRPSGAAARPDAIIATGRTDYPNQVNNVLCFPFIFRGALDVGATAINEAMKLACVEALADLALAEPSWPSRRVLLAESLGDRPFQVPGERGNELRQQLAGGGDQRHRPHVGPGVQQRADRGLRVVADQRADLGRAGVDGRLAVEHHRDARVVVLQVAVGRQRPRLTHSPT